MRYFLMFVVLIFVFGSCATAPKGSTTKKGGGGASSDINEIPDMKQSVPASLGGDSNLKLKLKLKTAPFRNVGDTNVFVPSRFSNVKSQGWKNMRDMVVSETAVSFIIDGIREYASNHTLPYGSASDISMSTGGAAPKILNGKIFCDKVSDSETKIYLTFTNNFTTAMAGLVTFHIYSYLDIKKSGGSISEVTLITRQVPSTASMMPDVEVDNMSNTIYYSVYISSNKENVTLQRRLTPAFSSGYETNYIFMKSDVKPDGIVSIFCINRLPSSWDSLIAAWGNDQNGGLIDRTYNFGSTTNNSFYNEFYNTNGSLVYYSAGSSSLDNTGWMDYRTNGFNLSDFDYSPAPSNIIALVSNMGGSNMVIITNNGGIPVTNFPDSFWFDVYYKAGSSWDTGDGTFSILNMNYQNGCSIITFGMDYTIPSPVSRLGSQYYMINTWPLKYLTLQSKYSGYQITRQVEYEDSWTNTWVNDTVEPPQYETNIGLWQRFNWWLDQANDQVFQSSSDIMVRNISEETFWLLDNATYQCVPQKGLMVKGTASSPWYFDFTQQPLVDTVTTSLNNLYNNEVVPFNMDAYYDSLPAFPDTNLFPAL